MRFGGFVFGRYDTAEEWVVLHQKMGYSACYFPFDYKGDLRVVDAYVKAAKDANLVIAEIGIWNNPLAANALVRQEAVEKCVRQLEFADYVGAKCCVNIAGSFGEQWDGPHKDNLTQRGFAAVVESCQKIIDTAKPKNTFYTLEPMPWMYPDSADSYLRLVGAIARKHFGVHLDPVNMINTPQLYYNTGAFLEDFFHKLGPHIKSCHAKDIRIGGNLTLHLDECCPGAGELDFATFLRCMRTVDDEVPLLLEHMTEEVDYHRATKFLKELGQTLSIRV